MEKTSRIQSTSLLISKKAYNDFTTRIRQTLGAVSQNSEPIDEAIALLDRYVKGEISDFDSNDLMVKVALMMLNSVVKSPHRHRNLMKPQGILKTLKTPRKLKTLNSPNVL